MKNGYNNQFGTVRATVILVLLGVLGCAAAIALFSVSDPTTPVDAAESIGTGFLVFGMVMFGVALLLNVAKDLGGGQ